MTSNTSTASESATEPTAATQLPAPEAPAVEPTGDLSDEALAAVSGGIKVAFAPMSGAGALSNMASGTSG